MFSSEEIGRSGGITRFKGTCVALLLAVFLATIRGDTMADGTSAIIPGINLSDISFREGERVSYLVISEAYRIRDSSVVTFSVLSSGERKAEIEIESMPFPTDPNAGFAMRVALSGLSGKDQRGDSSPVKFESIMISRGAGPFRAISEDEKADLDIDDYFFDPSDYIRKTLPPDTVNTPAGDFLCECLQFSRSRRDEMNLGGNRAVRFEQRETVLWKSSEVPFWGLVKSEVVNRRRTEIDSASIPPGLLKSGEKKYKSILISYVASVED